MQTQKIQVNNQTDEEILKDVMNGRYRDEYLIYNRKSTDEPENQKNSIKYQKSENVRFAYKEHLPIAPITLQGLCLDGIISEKHSGFKEDSTLEFGKDSTVQYRIERPKFYRLVQLLSKGYFKGVVVLCWDRASRNRGDDTVIRKLMKQGLDFRFTLASYDKTSSGALHMDIDGMFAEHHSRVTSEKVSLNIKLKRDQGICVHKAPVGYLNQGNMDHKPLDPARAPIIKKMFEMYGSGEWSLADIARWAIEQGFTMSPSRRQRTIEERLQEEEEDIQVTLEPICRIPTFNNIHKILINRFYTGEVVNSNDEYIPSISHEALVSKGLFDHVQGMLNKKNVSAHYKERMAHPLRGIVRCAVCKRLYTPYIKKGVTYFGSRCAKECSNQKRSVNLSYLIEKIDAILNRLYFTQGERDKLEASESTDIAIFEVKRHKELELNEIKKKKIREDLAYLVSNKLALLKTGAYTPESIATEERNLNNQLYKLQENEHASDVSMQETIKEIMKLSELVKTVYSYYQSGDSCEKEAIIKIIFSELRLDETGLKYKVKKEFQALQSRFLAPCDLTGWLSELLTHLPYIKQGVKELELYQ
jgi:site-specific DNA recombinase